MAGERHGHGMLCVNPPLAFMEWAEKTFPLTSQILQSRSVSINMICVCSDCVMYVCKSHFISLEFFTLFRVQIYEQNSISSR
jgi:hypothetical protein